MRYTNLHIYIEMFEHVSCKPIYCDQKVKGQGYQAPKKQVRVGLQTEHNVDACCVHKLCWVFPAADAAADRRVFVRGVFRSQQAWVMAHSCECWLLLADHISIANLYGVGGVLIYSTEMQDISFPASESTDRQLS